MKLINEITSSGDNTVDAALSTSKYEDQTYDFPYLLDRYKTMLIDGLIILDIVVICVIIKNSLGLDSNWISISCLIIILSYEPLLITYSATIGQTIMRIRVRNVPHPKRKISIARAYSRFVTKLLLGWPSFIIINFNKSKRAIHDYAASSIMIHIYKELMGDHQNRCLLACCCFFK